MTTPNSTTFSPETETSILALTPFDGQVLQAAYQCDTVVSFVAYIVELTRTGDIDKLTLLCRSALMYRLDDLIEAGGAE